MKFWSVAVTAAVAVSSVRAGRLDGLNECLTTCLTEAASKAGCAGEEDLACLCGDAYRNAAAGCLTTNAKCNSGDLTTALGLSSKTCSGAAPDAPEPTPEPSSAAQEPPASSEAPAPTSDTPAPTSDTPTPDPTETPTTPAPIEGLSECASKCLVEAASSQGCTGQDDIACVCTDEYRSAVTPCILQCGTADVTAALALSEKKCAGGGGGEPSAPPSPEPTSAEPEPTSAEPEPTSAEPEPTSTESAGTPEPTQIEGVSECASKCLIEAATAQGCSGQDDVACVCTDAYRTAVTPCISKCGAADITAALDLSAKKCSGGGGETQPTASPSAEPEPTPTGSAGTPEPTQVEGVSECASKCLVEAATAQGCKGQDDVACVCTDEYRTAVTPCISKCGPADITAALELSTKKCAGGSGGEPSPSAPTSAGPTGGQPQPTGGDPKPTGPATVTVTEVKTEVQTTTVTAEGECEATGGPGGPTEPTSPTTSGSGPTPTGGSEGGETQIEGVSACASKCLVEAASSQGCKGQDDIACVCTDAYRGAVTPCILQCGTADVTAALALSEKKCSGGAQPSGGETQPSSTPSSGGETEPSPTASGGQTTPTGGSEGGETIEGVSACASKCLVEAASSQGCKGQDDVACVCTDAYRGAVTPCILQCGSADVTAALALSEKKCSGGAQPTGGETEPSATTSGGQTTPTGGAEGGETIEGVSECASKCLVEAASAQGCKGQDDIACVCADGYRTAVTPCISKCGAADISAALALSEKKCSGAPQPTGGETEPSATPSGGETEPSATTSGGQTEPTGGSEGGETQIEGVSACASKCLVEAASSQGCSGQDDIACVCTDAYRGAVTPCILKCGTADVTAALALSEKKCSGGSQPSATPSGGETEPSATTSGGQTEPTGGSEGGETQIEGLTACGSKCLVDAAASQGCSGQDDIACVCKDEYRTAVTPCILACGGSDVTNALALSTKKCSGAQPTGGETEPSATPSGGEAEPSATTSGGQAEPTGSTQIEGLTACGSKCLVDAAAKQGCSGQDDIACVCTDEYRSAVTPCILACGGDDITNALALSTKKCSGAQPSGGETEPSATPSGGETEPSPTPSGGETEPSATTSGGETEPTGSTQIEGLTACGSKCLVDAAAKQGCSGQDDIACVCTDAYRGAVTPCILACGGSDITNALALSEKKCSGAQPSASVSEPAPTSTEPEPTASEPEPTSAGPEPTGSTEIEGLSACASKCLVDAAASEGCTGQDDVACVCTDKYRSTVTPCVLSCGMADVTAALALSEKKCSGAQPSASVSEPAPTSAEPEPTVSEPEPTSAGPEPTGSTEIEGLSACASKCLVDAAASEGCSGQDDVACVCTDKYRSAVTPCVLACGMDDVTAALALSEKKCSGAPPASSPGPEPTGEPTPTASEPAPTSSGPEPTGSTQIEGLSECASTCLVQAASAQGCTGQDDTACVCTAEYKSAVTPCILKCGGADISAALALSDKKCSGAPQPSGTSPGTPEPTPTGGGTGGLPDISKLSPCALGCVVESLPAAGCSGPTDTACLCTEKFVNIASKCLQAKCEGKDIVSSLNLQREMCPALGLPDLGSLGDCPLGCVLKTLDGNQCGGPLDKDCICKVKFSLATTGCLIKECKFKGLKEALQLQVDQCRGSSSQCEATGIWRLTNIKCWFQRREFYEEQLLERRGTPAAHLARTNAF